MRYCHALTLLILLTIGGRGQSLFSQDGGATTSPLESLAVSGEVWHYRTFSRQHELPVAVLESAAPWRLELNDSSVLLGNPGSTHQVPDFANWMLSFGQEIAIDTLSVNRLCREQLLPKFAAEQDLLWLKKSDGQFPDRRNGWLLSWQASGIEFEGPAGAKLHPWSEIFGMQLLYDEQPPLNSSQAIFISFNSSGFLWGQLENEDEQYLYVKTSWGANLKLAKKQIAAIFPAAGYVNKVEQVSVAVSDFPEAGFDWSPKINRSVESRRLTVAGINYPDGVGTKVSSELEVLLPAKTTFTGMVGVDDEVFESKLNTPIVFEILDQEELLWQSPEMHPGDSAIGFSVTIDESVKLRLISKSATNSSLGGHADWLVLRTWKSVD